VGCVNFFCLEFRAQNDLLPSPPRGDRDRIVAHGGQVKDSLDLVKGVVAHVPAAKRAGLNRSPTTHRWPTK